MATFELDVFHEIDISTSVVLAMLCYAKYFSNNPNGNEERKEKGILSP